MTSDSQPHQDPHVDEIVQQWDRLLAEGQFVPAEELCGDCPELIPEVERRIGQLVEMREKQRSSAVVGPSGQSGVSEAGDASQVSSESEAAAQDTGHDRSDTGHDKSGMNSLSTVGGAAPEDGFLQRAVGDAPTSDEVIFSVSQYDYFRFHAKGGLGEVYLAGDKDLHRQVALKFMQKRIEGSAESQNQFSVEGEVAAQLEHPGVVPVYGMGHTSDGRPFHVMRFIQGDTLGDVIDRFHQEHDGESNPGQRSVEFENLVSRFISVCNTIAYAHNRGILHRDIKPDNIMLGKYGETLVVDWGLALPVDRDEVARASGEQTLMPGSGGSSSDFSSRGGVVGTPSYMSPEQATDGAKLTPASDIYSLGALLYKLITGHTPVEGSHLREIIKKVRKGDFPPPREVNHNVPRDLEAVCLKAMANNPKDRYVTALELKADLERWRADELVSAYQESAVERVFRWTRNNRKWTQAAAATLLAVLVASTAWLTSTWNHHRDLINQQLDSLKTKADVEQAMLLRDFQMLQQDAQFLATRPSLRAIKSNQKIEQATKENLAVSFQDYLAVNPSYMQARFLDKTGMEIVRVDRKQPGAEVTVKASEELQNKGDRKYFLETIQLAKGEVYLSKLELNQEHGKKQWDFPVIRAAVPVWSDETPIGIVIINMHFSRLTDFVKESASEGLLVHLTNDQGQFLLHPVSDIDFCFERDLDFPIEDTYPRLATFRLDNDSEQTDIKLTEVTPLISLLVHQTDGASDALTAAVSSLYTKYPRMRPRFSKEKDRAILTGLDQSQLDGILSHIKSGYSEKLETHALPSNYQNTSQAVYCRKIFFDKRQPERFLGLVLVLQR